MLNPLETHEAQAYVDYRLAAYGGSVETLFARGAIDHLLAHSRRIPRRINVLCHNAMLRAFHAGESRVSLESACDAVREVDRVFAGPHLAALSATSSFVQRRVQALVTAMPGLAPALIAATLAIAGIGSLYFWNSQASHRAELIGMDAVGPVGDAVIEYPDADPASSVTAARQHATADRTLLTSRAPASGNRPPRQVRVRPGDTLLTIARSYLGSDDEVDRLIRANPQVGNINHIYPGEILKLPAVSLARHSDSSMAHETVASDAQSVAPRASAANYDGGD
jgi:LysM repeat protein